MALGNTLAQIDAQLQRSIDQLKDFVRIPSISAGTDAQADGGITQAAEFLVDQFVQMGSGKYVSM